MKNFFIREYGRRGVVDLTPILSFFNSTAGTTGAVAKANGAKDLAYKGPVTAEPSPVVKVHAL